MGTMHEIGYWEGAIDENTPCNPLSMYGIAKDALRRCMIQYTQQKECIYVCIGKGEKVDVFPFGAFVYFVGIKITCYDLDSFIK